MDLLLLGWIPTLASIATVAIILWLGQWRSTSIFQARWRMKSGSQPPSIKPTGDPFNEVHEQCNRPNRDGDGADQEELIALKRLYHQLHSLEKFPEVLPQAKRLLLALIAETSATAQVLSNEESILSVHTFSRRNLEDFQHRRNETIGKQWEQYNMRRKEGGLRELFEDKEEAIWWLKQISPAKYVDGAWLGHIGKVTTPFSLQKTMKGAWQVLSEELGDGDLGKNHVHVYHNLLESLAPDLPAAGDVDFGHPQHHLDELPVWKSAVAQLIVSLYPSEFLPEILGFNLHFEAVSMDTLKAAKELREVGIDPYYFILHVSIDNAHSGHTAIAIEVCCEYMEYVRSTQGEEAVEKAWRKLQAGYLLSSGLPGTAICPSRRQIYHSDIPLSPIETEVMGIFQAKAQVVQGIHCSSRVRIGSRSVVDWLNPVALKSKEWQRELLNALSCSTYWIRKGDSGNSRFIKELQWGGRMFGSFTQDEYDLLKRWVDNLPDMIPSLQPPYMRAKAGVNHDDTEDNGDILNGDPIFVRSAIASSLKLPSLSTARVFCFQDLPHLDVGSCLRLEKFLPLWLSHPCLLQAFVSVPFRTRNNLACTIVRILRAQGGFDIEQECVAGMSEVRRTNSLGLVGIGMNVMAHHEISITVLHSLKQVLQVWPSEFATLMVHISMRPLEFKGLLIGMATAFAKMHEGIVMSQLPSLSLLDRETLKKIAQRELEGLELCWKELESDEERISDCCKGYLRAGQEIEKCFRM